MFESYLINFSWKFNLKVTFKRVRLNFIIIDIVFKYFFFLDILNIKKGILNKVKLLRMGHWGDK